MRVCVLNWRDPAHPLAGGAEVYTSEVVSRWAAAGDEVVWFAGAVPGLPTRERTTDGVEMVRAGGRLGVYPAAYRWWRREGRRRGFDLVIDEINTIPFLSPRWDLGGAAVLALIHQTAEEVWTAELGPLGRIGAGVEPRLLRPYRDVPTVTVSPSSRRSLEAMGLRDVHVLPQGTDPLAVPPHLPELPGEPALVWVGRLSANKRPLHAIAALAELRRAHPRARLDIIGDGPQRDAVERVAAATGGVTVHGRVPAERRNALLAAADLLVTTSVREGWGLNVSEAAALGTAAVGYAVPGLVDSIPASGGLLCEPTPTALARACHTALGEHELVPRRSTVDWSELSRRFRALAATVVARSPVALTR